MATLRITDESFSDLGADAIIVLANKDLSLTDSGKKLDQQLKKALSRALSKDQFQALPGRTFLFYNETQNPSRVFVAASATFTTRLSGLREAACLATRAASKRGAKKLVIAFDPENEDELQAIAEGALLAGYQYQEFKSEQKKTQLKSITVCGNHKSKNLGQKAKVLSEASMFTRDLVNEPANTMNPLRLAQLAEEAAALLGLEIEVFRPEKLLNMGMNAFLSVGKGSTVPCRMIHLTYKPAEESRAHIALVGKGITFDSGGLSLKTEKGMEHMKSDMTGAAIVLACLRGAAQLHLPVTVTGLMMATENMPNASANRPGDVVEAMNGKTIEITNTDAEGRLALADGLWFAQSLSPDYLVDIATLTGAQMVSLGRMMGALLSNNEDLAGRIQRAGEKSGEPFWQLPLYEPYRYFIKSDIADIRNSSGNQEAPTIQAGLFLSEFIQHDRWAHLDIAGPSWQDREYNVFSRNASGFGVRCLLEFLSDF